jgi:hypothetical protein
VPASPSCLVEPGWEQFGQFAALSAERRDEHPWGCHRPRISDRVVFELLINVLVFGVGFRRHPRPSPLSSHVATTARRVNRRRGHGPVGGRCPRGL